MNARLWAAAALAAALVASPSAAQPKQPPAKKIVLIAGALDKGHPKGTHEYARTVELLKHCLETSDNVKGVLVEAHVNDWPKDDKTLNDADTVVLVSSGADRNVQEHPLFVGDRMATLAKQMKRGCGLVVIHWGVFVPSGDPGERFLDWIGGYFDYDRGPKMGKRSWYSKIQTLTTKARPAEPRHPVCRGVAPFEIREEFYYRMRFRPGDKRLVPLLHADIPGEQDPQTVAWGVERADGGRGFGFTGGHFFDNWKAENFRRLVLNAILWTARADVPEGGVRSALPGDRKGEVIRALIVTGNQHPAHLWRETTPAIREALQADPRFRVEVTEDIEYLARKEVHGFDVVVMNYCNWQSTAPGEKARANFVEYLKNGGGLAVVHFANGAWHPTLPGSEKGDWPEWRTKICRRVWEVGKSGHDAHGKFIVEIVDKKHPVTRGIKSYVTADELYYRQQGGEPVEVLATAKSRDTGKDEPMATVHAYGKGRVFQTMLGHDAASLRVAGTAELLRRGSVWAASREQAAK